MGSHPPLSPPLGFLAVAAPAVRLLGSEGLPLWHDPTRETSTMRSKNRIAAAFVVGVCGLAAAANAQTAFTYQARMTDAGAAANGPYDFQFKLFNAATAGVQVGATVVVNDLAVAGGLFTTKLDFGDQFDGSARFLQIEIRPGASTGAYTVMGTRIEITAAPYASQAKAAFALDAADGSPTNAVFVDNGGLVGIGTATPGAPLHVIGNPSGGLQGEGIRITGPLSTPANLAYMSFLNSAGTAIGYVGDGSSTDNNVFLGSYVGDVTLVTTGGGRVLTAGSDGSLRLGTSSGDYRRFVLGGGNSDGFIYGSFPHFADGIHMGYNYYANNAGANVIPHTDGGTSRVTMGYGFVTIATAPAFGGEPINRVTVDETGNMIVQRDISVRALTIRGGADLAEPFDVASSQGAEPAPGMLVVIDPANPGKLMVSTTAYDAKIAGAVSGANGLSPGMVMSADDHEHARGEHPIAMTGRVWVWCDASFGAITPGDRLTTSTTPGHAMRATDAARADGAVVGKAMTELKEGTGLVLVLVNLQ